MSADRGRHVGRRRCRTRWCAHQDEAGLRQMPNQILGGNTHDDVVSAVDAALAVIVSA
jgi:hypothetical protein